MVLDHKRYKYPRIWLMPRSATANSLSIVYSRNPHKKPKFFLSSLNTFLISGFVLLIPVYKVIAVVVYFILSRLL